MAPLIAAQWAELRCADPMAGQSPEGLPVVWRLVDHTAALPTVAHMVEPQCAGLTEGQPSLLVALIGPTTARVPSQRVSQLGRLPVRRRLRLLAITHPTAIRRLIILLHPGSD